MAGALPKALARRGHRVMVRIVISKATFTSFECTVCSSSSGLVSEIVSQISIISFHIL